MLDAALHSIETGKLDDARDVLGTALDRQRQTIRELRDLSFALEPVVLRDQGFGAGARRRSPSRSAREPAPRSTSTSTTRSALGETAQVALYTIIRELLDQAVRRGPPTRIEVTHARARRRRHRDASSSTTPSPSGAGARSRRSRSA